MVDTDYARTTMFHCIKCGKIWGKGNDVDSYGICIECFGEWAITKCKYFGVESCVFKDHCPLYKYCKEYYEFKQDLSR